MNETYRLGYYSEDTKTLYFEGNDYAKYGEAMQAADNAGDWFEPVIGDHRAIDVVMSLAYAFDVDPDWYEDMDELTEEIKRQHAIAPTKEEIRQHGYKIDMGMCQAAGWIMLDKDGNICDENPVHRIEAVMCFDEDDTEVANYDGIPPYVEDEILDSLATMLFEERIKGVSHDE